MHLCPYCTVNSKRMSHILTHTTRKCHIVSKRYIDRCCNMCVCAGQYILRKLGALGLLTGTQVFVPSQLRHVVGFSYFFFGDVAGIVSPLMCCGRSSFIFFWQMLGICNKYHILPCSGIFLLYQHPILLFGIFLHIFFNSEL